LPRSLPGAGALLRGLGHFYRGARAACLRWRRGGIPSSWATPACMPCSSTPADRSHPASPMRAMLPSAYITTSAPRLGFRGSITRPTGSLCTLRSRGRPRTTQHSVPAGGQPWPVRSCTCWVAKKVSALLVSLHGFLLHQALLGAIHNPPYFVGHESDQVRPLPSVLSPLRGGSTESLPILSEAVQVHGGTGARSIFRLPDGQQPNGAAFRILPQLGAEVALRIGGRFA